jgi:hypothetical protein
MLDEVEALGDSNDLVPAQFLNEFLPAIHDILESVGYPIPKKVLLSGRYIGSWESVAEEVILHVMNIQPFDFPVVRQTVGMYAKAVNKPAYSNNKVEIASHLMYLTGGHPACMAEILEKYSLAIEPGEYLLKNEDEIYGSILSPRVSDIQDHIPANLQSIFDALSPIRRFNPKLLRYFIMQRLIEWSGSTYELASRLTGTYLITRRKGFLQDDIARRLLATQLLRKHKNRYAEICKAGSDFYDKELQQVGVSRPDIVALERLFQCAQRSSLSDSPQKEKEEEVFSYVPELLELLSARPDNHAVVRSFREELESDWEFRFFFNYWLRDDGYDDDPYQHLLQKVDELEASLEECDDA